MSAKVQNNMQKQGKFRKKLCYLTIEVGVDECKCATFLLDICKEKVPKIVLGFSGYLGR